ncbi:MAG: hypothetical protein ACRC1K_06870, partial [Planctomycetia bacterium]
MSTAGFHVGDADAAATSHAVHAHPAPTTFLGKYVFSLDHKVIGIQFLVSSMFWLFVGGALALAIRWQLAFPWQSMPIVGPR